MGVQGRIFLGFRVKNNINNNNNNYNDHDNDNDNDNDNNNNNHNNNSNNNNNDNNNNNNNNNVNNNNSSNKNMNLLHESVSCDLPQPQQLPIRVGWLGCMTHRRLNSFLFNRSAHSAGPCSIMEEEVFSQNSFCVRCSVQDAD